MLAYLVSMATSDVTDGDAYIGKSRRRLTLRSKTTLGRSLDRRTDAGWDLAGHMR